MTEAQRVWGFNVDIGFQEHYAPAFGTVVKSRSHAETLAKIASEQNFLRTGIESNCQVIDAMDDEAVGITKEEKDHYLADTRRAAVNSAAWNARRARELDAERDRKRAEKQAEAAKAIAAADAMAMTAMEPA
jgi:hypothetical protein